MRLNWTDQYLSWDPSQYGGESVNFNLSPGFLTLSFLYFFHFCNETFFSAGLKQIHFGQSEIWKPDIQLYNNADSANMQVYIVTMMMIFILLIINIVVIFFKKRQRPKILPYLANISRYITINFSSSSSSIPCSAALVPSSSWPTSSS